jgi:hypothetical protein
MDTGKPFGEHVEDGRLLAGLLDNMAQCCRVVALQIESDLDLLVAIADVPGHPEDAEQVDVAFDG